MISQIKIVGLVATPHFFCALISFNCGSNDVEFSFFLVLVVTSMFFVFVFLSFFTG